MIPSIKEQKTEKGFWIPNELIDLYLPILRARGLACYCCIARSVTRWQYPGVVDLACQLRITESQVRVILQKLHELELLNDADLRAIEGEL